MVLVIFWLGMAAICGVAAKRKGLNIAAYVIGGLLIWPVVLLVAALKDPLPDSPAWKEQRDRAMRMENEIAKLKGDASDPIQKLKELKALRDDGAISAEEFQTMRKAYVPGGTPVSGA